MKTQSTNRKKLISIFSVIVLLLSVAESNAQQKDSIKAAKAADREIHYLKNNVKINLSSLALNNYSFYAERSLSRKISFSAGYRTMPNTNLGGLAIVQKISDLVNDGEPLLDDLDQISVKGSAFTAEFRFYGGKKPGARGFYIAPYVRYSKFENAYNYDFEGQNNNSVMIPLQSKVSGLGAGLMIGKQILIAKHITFDSYIIGGHYGKLKGTSIASVNLSSLSDEDKRGLKEKLDYIVDIDKPILNSIVTDQGVTGKISGPFAGIRGLGFSLGITF